MNSIRTTISCIFLLSFMAAGLTHARAALAGHDAVEPAGAAQVAANDTGVQTGATTQPPAKNQKAATSGADDDSAKLGPRIASRIAKISKLRTMMEEKVGLTSAQKTKIDRLFEDFIDDTKNSTNANKRRKDPNTPPNKIFPPSMRDLEKQLQKAKESGDEAAVERIRQEIKILKKEPPMPSDDHSSVLIEKITDELNPDQRPVFAQVVARWQAIAPRGPRTGPFQQLRRALQDPEVGLSEADRASIDKILADTLKSVRSGSIKSGPDKMAEAVEKARVVIYEKLTPQQRAKVDANLKMFRAEEKEWDDSQHRGPHRVDRPKDRTKTDAKKEPIDKSPTSKPESPKPDDE